MTKIDLSQYDQDELLAEAYRRFGKNTAAKSLEDIITTVEGFGLVSATPLQRAICRIIDGRPLGELRHHPDVKFSVGDCRHIDGIRPLHIILACCTRGGKSLITSGAGIRSTQVCDMAMIGPGEPPPRVSILSTSKDNADVIMKYVTGNLAGRPGLKGLLLSPPTKQEVIVRGPRGLPVEMKVVAGERAGATLVSRWSASVLIDEAAKMLSAGDGVINLDDARTVSYSRLLPGAQLIEISSPWLPVGPIYNDVSAHWGGGENFGKIFATPELVVIRARGPQMNPAHWTPEFMARLMKKDPRAFQMDCLAEFCDADDSFFPQVVIKSCMRDGNYPLPAEKGCEYSACMDPATRGNAWTLVVSTKKGNVKHVVGLWEWRGSALESLSPRAVLAEIAATLRGYGLHHCFTDQWSADTMVDLADEEGLDLLVETRRRDDTAKAFLALLLEMQAGRVVLPPSEQLRRDLTLVRKVPSPSPPGFKVVLPVTSDGRHCDFAPSLVGSLMRWIDEQTIEESDRDYGERLTMEAIEREKRRLANYERMKRGEPEEELPSVESDDPLLGDMRFL